ncbi:MAG: DNA translocase FtsK [Clostridia bacterium]|nr:DNA translocase FtsK [Clostridia bacterium]
MLASAVILLVLALFKGEHFWNWLHSVMFGIFGFCSYLLPLALGYFAIMTAKEKQMNRPGAKVALVVLTVLLVSSLFYLFGSGDLKDINLFKSIGKTYTYSSQNVFSGGVISCVLGYTLTALIGDNFVPKLIVIVALIAVIMILTGISLIDIENVAKKQMIALRERKRRYDEEHRQLYEDEPQRDFSDVNRDNARIDIPIDGRRKKKRQATPDIAVEEELTPPLDTSASDKLINSVRIANGDYIDDTDIYQASQIARQITDSKNNPITEEGAKQANPETVGIDPKAKVDINLEEEEKAIEAEIKAEAKPAPSAYTFPSVRLLRQRFDSNDGDAMRELQNNATKLVDTLKSFGVSASITNICRGPSVTRYELKPAAGVKINKITNLADDIALNLAADKVRIEAPIPGKAAVGIEVPNKFTSVVTMRELIDSDEFKRADSKLTCVLGKDISGEIVSTDLAKMPHLLIAGTTGSGKSVCVNSILMSILYKATPEQVKFVLIDPKMVEFSKYKGLPHLLVPVVSDAKKAAGALNWAVTEMMQRYRLFSEYDCKEIHSYNRLIDANLKFIEENSTDEEEVCMEVSGLPVPKEKLPQIVIAIDELADLMMAAPKEVEDAICRLAQMARAAGMHLVIATQRPSVNVITGVIKANIPSRIALKVSSQVDSRTILDFGGAENLIGRGDMLFAPVGVSKPIRVQGCFATDEEIEGVTNFIKNQNKAQYNEDIEEQIRRITAEDLDSKNKGGSDEEGELQVDAKMEEAIKCVIDAGQASTSLLQRRLKVGYARAGRMIDDMEQMGIVGPHQGAKPRDVLITYQDWLERTNRIDS